MRNLKSRIARLEHRARIAQRYAAARKEIARREEESRTRLANSVPQEAGEVEDFQDYPWMAPEFDR